jgi:hypothetical protein
LPSCHARFLRAPACRLRWFREPPGCRRIALRAGRRSAGLRSEFEMVRGGCGGHAAHRDDLATVHVVGCRDGLKDPEASFVAQGFRYFLNLRTVHGATQSVVKSSSYRQNPLLPHRVQETCIRLLRCSSKYRNLTGHSKVAGGVDAPGEDQAGHSTNTGRPT